MLQVTKYDFTENLAADYPSTWPIGVVTTHNADSLMKIRESAFYS